MLPLPQIHVSLPDSDAQAIQRANTAEETDGHEDRELPKCRQNNERRPTREKKSHGQFLNRQCLPDAVIPKIDEQIDQSEGAKKCAGFDYRPIKSHKNDHRVREPSERKRERESEPVTKTKRGTRSQRRRRNGWQGIRQPISQVNPPCGEKKSETIRQGQLEMKRMCEKCVPGDGNNRRIQA